MEKIEWARLAGELGFEFHQELEAFLESPALWGMVDGNVGPEHLAAARAGARNPLIKSLVARVFTGVATGQHRGFAATLFPRADTGTKGRTPRYFVRLILLFAAPCQAGWAIRPASAASRFWRRIMPRRYVQVPGDHEFNRRLLVRAKDPNAAMTQLDAGRRERLVALCDVSRDFILRDEGIRLEEPGRIISASRARDLLDAMASVAERFQ